MKKICHENVARADELGALVKQRCECMDQADARTGNLEKAFANGKDAKHVRDDLLPHGQFGTWIAKHELEKSEIYNYIALAKNEEIIRREGCKSIRQALKVLKALKALKPKKGKKPESTETGAVVSLPTPIDAAAVAEWLDQDPLQHIEAVLERISDATRLTLVGKMPVLAKKVRLEMRARGKMFRNKEEALAAIAKAKAASQTQQLLAAAEQVERDDKVVAFRRPILQPALN